MNIHLPAILGFTRYQGFDPSPHGNSNSPINPKYPHHLSIFSSECPVAQVSAEWQFASSPDNPKGHHDHTMAPSRDPVKERPASYDSVKYV